MYFVINGIEWSLVFVPSFSEYLQRSDGSYTIGMTDSNTNTVYICNKLHGDKLRHVICHEITHAICFSYDIYMPIELEEKLCNFVADYGEEIIYLVEDIIKNISQLEKYAPG